MITFLRTWANQIIVALIVATIFEMILPDGNNKKYIKMIIGLYVLFTITQPLVAKITGNDLQISNFTYKKYFENSAILETYSNDFENNNSKLIEHTYINNIKNDIIIKLKQKGYDVVKCDINILNDANATDYGVIKSIQIKLKEIEENKENQNNYNIQVENVEVSVNHNTIITEENNLSNKEKTEIIEYLSNEYSIEKEKIIIN